MRKMKANNLATILSISFLTAGCSSPPKEEPVQPVPSSLQSQVEDLRASARAAHLPSTPLRKPTVESDAPIGLPFTIDTFLAKNPGLKPIESLGEFKTSQKFSSDFVDGSGTVTGEFTKKTRKLQHVSLIGDGQIWTKTVEEIVLLSFNDSDKCNKILEGLTANPSDASISIDGLRFQLSIMADHHLLQLTNENDAVKTQTELASDYVTPTVNVTISNFKKNFNRRMTHVNPKLQIYGNGEETTTPAYFAFNFSDDTTLNVYADEKTMVIQNIELDGVRKESAKFWQCADACITALNPHASPTSIAGTLAHVSGGNTKNFPAQSIEFDEGTLNYACSIMSTNSDACVLTVQSNKP